MALGKRLWNALITLFEYCNMQKHCHDGKPHHAIVVLFSAQKHREFRNFVAATSKCSAIMAAGCFAKRLGEPLLLVETFVPSNIKLQLKLATMLYAHLPHAYW